MTARYSLGLAAALLAFAPPARAALLSVQEALTKADALKERGVFAVFSSDFGLLKDNMMTAGKAWRAQVNTAEPKVCAPPRANYTSDDAMVMLRTVTPALRVTTPARDAIIAGLNERYRCH